jgi:hypothetical protein
LIIGRLAILASQNGQEILWLQLNANQFLISTNTFGQNLALAILAI